MPFTLQEFAFLGSCDEMAFAYKNKKGNTYYLHNKGKLFYFGKEQKENACDLPEGCMVIESEKTGLPMVKRK